MTRLKYTGITMLAALAVLFAAVRTAKAQVTKVQDLGTAPASQAFAGLGWNADPTQEWQFKAIADAGGTHVRFQCGWERVESQTAPPDNTNTATKYALPVECQNALTWSKKYTLAPSITAAYGAPYHTLLNFTVPGGAATGATTLNIQFNSGVNGVTLAALKPFYDLFLRSADNTPVTTLHAYAGGLIIAVKQTDATHATLTLASGLTAALPADATLYKVNELLYPPCFTFSATDPSVVAFANYAQFLATQIAANGLKGEVELWNEPPWDDDPWDEGENLYDAFPGFPVANGPTTHSLPNWGFIANLQTRTDIPAGVTFIWAGTNKSGTNSALSPDMLTNSGATLREPNNIVTAESLHPYGNNPEDAIWSEPCLKKMPSNLGSCNLNNPGANMILGELWDLQQKSQNPTYGINHVITETGIGTVAADDAHRARHTMRQFIGFQPSNIKEIEFFLMLDPGGNYSFFQGGINLDGSHTPLAPYTALAGFMSTIAPIHNAPVASYTESDLASVATYTGTYPLDIVHLVGARTGDTANSELVSVWQHSQAADNANWGVLPQPAAAPVALLLPANTAVASVINLSTRAAVPFTISGGKVSFSVSDDPIGVMINPLAPAPSVTVQSASVPYQTTGAPLTAWVAYTGAVPPTGAVTFTIGGQTLTATCQPTASPLTCTTPYPASQLIPGSYTITTSVAADTHFSAASGAGTLTIPQPDFTLTNAGSTTAALAPGGSVLYAFTLSPMAGAFPQAVTITASGLPAGVAYTLTPTSVAGIAGTQSVQLHLVQGTASLEQPVSGPMSQTSKVEVASVFGLLMFLGRGKRKRIRQSLFATLLAVFAIGAGLCGLSGCALTTTAATKPAQTYTIVVTATSGALQHSSTVNLSF